MSETFFIADMHVGHQNALALDNRPFTDIATHDQVLADYWKTCVGKEDHIYVLGDVYFGNVTAAAQYYGELPGHKHLIIGNHDHQLVKKDEFREQWKSIESYAELRIPLKKRLILSHYPILAFNRHYAGSYHFYGHVHNFQEAVLINQCRKFLEAKMGCPCKMYNVGAMMPWMGYMPRTFEEIIGCYVY